jgi:hypothetical protein
MTLLTPTERVTLEMIRDKGTTGSAERNSWALLKGYAEPDEGAKGKHKLTEAGTAALASHADQRRARRAANRPRRR